MGSSMSAPDATGAEAAETADHHAPRKAAARPELPHPVLKSLKTMEMPFILKAIFSMPTFISKHLVPAPECKGADCAEATGKPSYTFLSTSEDVLTVAYYYTQDPMMIKFTLDGLTEAKKEELLQKAGPDKAQMMEDFKACEHCRSLKPEEGIRGEYYRQGFKFSGKMAVIRMSDGGVLLFNPVRISEEVKERIDKMGAVKWIVTGSAYHTSFVKSAKDAFPEAKVVAPTAAKYKLAKVSTGVDYDYTCPDDMKTLRDAFHGEFELHYVPDPVCHTLVMVQCSSGMLFEVDILYMLAESKEMTKSVGGRISKASLLGDSPNGFLPSYRFTSLLGGFFPGVPAASPNCREETLQAMIALADDIKYSKVWSAHWDNDLMMKGDDFRQWLKDAWISWLKDPSVLLARSAEQ